MRKTLAKSEKMCYNISRAPVIRLYRGAVDTSVQGCRSCDTIACLFLYLYYTAKILNCQLFPEKFFGTRFGGGGFFGGRVFFLEKLFGKKFSQTLSKTFKKGIIWI